MTQKAITVLYYAKARKAIFDCKEDAIKFGRERSRSDGTVEVSDHLGMIAVFERGKATPDFAHLDQRYPPPYEPMTYSDVVTNVRTSFQRRLDGLSEGERTEKGVREILDEVIHNAIPSFNPSLTEILASDLSLGYPDDRAVMETDSIFVAIHGSIAESLNDAMRSDLEEAIQSEDEDDAADA